MKTLTFIAIAIFASTSACSQAEAPSSLKTDKSAEQEQALSETSDRSANAEDTLTDWPPHSRAAARDQIQKYGKPDDATYDTLTWRNKGPWLWTRIDRRDTAHGFPTEHFDSIEQAVYYKVPADKVDDLNAFDGSITVYRTRGFLAARCDTEVANFLALNLAHDIIMGSKDAAEARAYYQAAMVAFGKGTLDPYMKGLRFRPQSSSAADVDRAA